MTMLQLSALRRLRWLGLGGLALLIASCQPPAPTSVNALDGRVAADGSELLGAWYGELDGSEAYVHVVDGAGSSSALQTVIIAHQDRNGKSGSWGSASAIPASIDGLGYLSVKLEENEGQAIGGQDYLIVRYRTTHDHRHVSLYAMDSDRVSQAIKNHEIEGSLRDMRISAEPAELVKFIQATGGQDLFSIQIGYLERVAEDEMPTPGQPSRR
jgi:hypothetical protein